MTSMTKSPAHWERPGFDRGSAVDQEKEIKVGKSDLKAPRDQDWTKAGKEQGIGFSGNSVDVLVRGANPAAGEYRRPPEHTYKVPGTGAGVASARIEQQNRLSGKSKR
jgi:hypothetical protein